MRFYYYHTFKEIKRSIFYHEIVESAKELINSFCLRASHFDVFDAHHN